MKFFIAAGCVLYIELREIPHFCISDDLSHKFVTMMLTTLIHNFNSCVLA